MLLDILENEEAKSLAWGLTEIYLSKEDIKSLAERDGFLDWEDLLENLKDENKVVKYKGGYRTRMAESVRLISQLRQLFPIHANFNAWKQASSLVGDYRFLKREREYPKRDLGILDLLDLIPDLVQKEIAKHLLENLKYEKLSRFQVDGTVRILSELSPVIRGNACSGSIICAGTGSGKTLAYYLPAMIHLGQSVRADQSNWVRAISIYPRTELLKDQMTEALKFTRQLNTYLINKNCRKLTLGAFFGKTPYENNDNDTLMNSHNWIKHHAGWLCPYVRCPDCGGELIWMFDDQRKNINRLICQNNTCRCSVEEVIITRNSMENTHPDILFSTTEMLNRNMSSSSIRKLFGIGTHKKPKLLLLDEVHTYGGVHGAQTAFLLRRWKKMSGTEPHIVGLSATLRNAKVFFGKLTGCKTECIEEIKPALSELIKEGSEYVFVLRNDPAEKASLLSTTIQTGMLLRRLLDRERGGTYGSKIFAFTDDLDVTNRLTYNLRDAEGRDSWGRYDHQRDSLAVIRTPSRIIYNDINERKERFLNGQIWNLSYLIGFKLDSSDKLIIGRTSSQDPGVDEQADIIVATASLDVGFNDPEVGAVIQHKAPRNMAQFIQRKGRAGRRREMRPWTVVVLSDYGRDRMLYQSYEQIFDPELPPNQIPISNKYVLKMQAVFSFMDWISLHLKFDYFNVWNNFSEPVDNDQLKEQYIKILEELLNLNHFLITDLTNHLCNSLQENEEIITRLLWEPPRALLTTVIPTIHRRISSHWARNGIERQDRFKKNNPLPEFIPQSLFSPLNLPELEIIIPPSRQGGSEEVELIPVHRGLKEFTPGRISKRYAIDHQYQKHWIEYSATECIDIKTFCEKFYEQGIYFYKKENANSIEAIRCIRPLVIKTKQAPKNILDTSNAFPEWHTQIIERRGEEVHIPSRPKCEALLEKIISFTHSFNCPIEIRRFSTGTILNIKIANDVQNLVDKRQSFVLDENPSALGFSMEVDALRFDLNMPENILSVTDPVSLRTLRCDFFRYKIASNDQLTELGINSFQKEWLSQIFLSALILYLHRNTGLNVRDAIERYIENLDYHEIMNLIFQNEKDDLDDNDASATKQNPENNVNIMNDFFEMPKVNDIIRKTASVLYETLDETWKNWLQEKYKCTVGSAIMGAIYFLCPDIELNEICLDIDSGPDSKGLENVAVKNSIWITESTVGGGGAIEQLLKKYEDDPTAFFNVIEGLLGKSEYEVRDEELQKIINLTLTDSVIRDNFSEVLNSSNPSNKFEKYKNLQNKLIEKSILMNHSIVSSISSRLLKPGISVGDYSTIADILKTWSDLEEKFDIEIDMRLVPLIIPNQINWDYNQTYSLLWPRGTKIRNGELTFYNPFVNLPYPERLLVKNKMENVENFDIIWEGTPVDTDNPTIEILKEQLSKNGEVALILGNEVDQKTILFNALFIPVDKNGLILYPRVKKIKKNDTVTKIYLQIGYGMQ